MSSKNKIYIWFLLNSLIFTLIIIYPSLIRTPLPLVGVFTDRLIRTKSENDELYGTPIDGYFLFIIVLIIGSIVYVSIKFDGLLESVFTDFYVRIFSIFILIMNTMLFIRKYNKIVVK